MKAIELTIQERQQIFVALIGYRNLFRGVKMPLTESLIKKFQESTEERIIEQ